MASTPYSVGTITVTNGSTSVAGTDTFWVGKTRANDMLFVPAQGLMARITADPTDNGVMAITAWAGTSLTDAAYEIIPASDTTTSAARLRDLLAQMSVIEANGRGLFYRFSDSVADGDPSSGYIRLNNAAIGSATAAYIDNLDANGAAVSGEIDTWDDSTSLTKGSLWLRSIADPSAFHAFKVTGSVVDGTGYRKLTLAYVGGSSTFSADDDLMVFFVPTGDTGDGFAYDETAATPAGLTAYEAEAAGFLVFVTDLQTGFGAYSGRSGVVRLIAGPAWEPVALYTGTQGVQGMQGIQGVQGERGITWQGDYSGATAYAIDDGVLYNGSSWRALQATTGNAPPTLPTTSNAYWQLLARRGVDGAGTVSSVVAGDGIAVDLTDPTAPVISSTVPPTDTSGIEANIAAMAFEIADLKGVRLNMVGGIADAYDTETDVDTSSSTNQVYDAGSDLYSPSTTGGAIPGATGTNFGDATSAGGLAAAFDGVTDGSAAADQVAALSSATSIYVGKTYSTAKKISQAVVYGASDQGYVNSVNPNVTLTLYGKTGAAPGNATDGTLLGAATFADENNVARTITSSDTTTQWDHVWIRANQSDSPQAMFVAEVIFYEPGTRNNMTLLSKAFTAGAQPDTARIALFVVEHESITINTDLIVEVTRDDATWTAAVLVLVSNPVGTVKMYEDNNIDISAQPAGTTMKYRTKTLNEKYIDATGTVFQWK